MFRLLLAGLTLASVVNLLACESTSLNAFDRDRLKTIVELKGPLSENELSNIYYYTNVNLLLAKTLPDASKICSHIKAQTSDNLESIYFITSTAKLLGNCQVDVNKYITKLQSLVQAESSVIDLLRAGSSLVNLGKPIDSAKFSKFLVAAIKRDETLLNTGLAFQLASKFTKPEDRNIFVDKIGDVIVQADEVNERLLQFEGGLGVSAAIINGIYQLATASNKPIGLTNEQALKFVNYFLSRKYVLTPKGASEVIESLSLFTNNKYHIPLIISKYASSALSAEKPILTVKVSNVLGLPVNEVTAVNGVSLTRKGETKPILENISFKPVAGDSTLWASQFFSEKPLPAGFYSLLVNANPNKADSRFFGNSKVEIKISILTEIDYKNAELTIADLDVGSKVFKLNFPDSYRENLEADYSQRIQLKFQIQERFNKENVQVHQAFVRFFNEETKQEIIFIAEQDSTGLYKIDLNLQVRAKDFNYLSGDYEVSLIVGDALVVNSVEWKIATLTIAFGSQTTNSQSSQSEYSAKPEIRHIFREQEKRPHPLVSNFFTFLVIVPLLALFVMWIKIGVNLSAFKLSLSGICFHLSLASIFLLYGYFFVKLDMFQTVKYLAAFGLFAYVSGHSLLSSLIKKRK